MRLSEPYYSLVSSKKKSIELRIYDEKRKQLAVGDLIRFTDTNGKHGFCRKVKKLRVFPDFETAIRSCTLKRCLPNVSRVKEGVKVYHSIPGYSMESKKYGVIAIFM